MVDHCEDKQADEAIDENDGHQGAVDKCQSDQDPQLCVLVLGIKLGTLIQVLV